MPTQLSVSKPPPQLDTLKRLDELDEALSCAREMLRECRLECQRRETIVRALSHELGALKQGIDWPVRP